jgi:hypothetical protein
VIECVLNWLTRLYFLNSCPAPLFSCAFKKLNNVKARISTDECMLEFVCVYRVTFFYCLSISPLFTTLGTKERKAPSLCNVGLIKVEKMLSCSLSLAISPRQKQFYVHDERPGKSNRQRGQCVCYRRHCTHEYDESLCTHGKFSRTENSSACSINKIAKTWLELNTARCFLTSAWVCNG